MKKLYFLSGFLMVTTLLMAQKNELGMGYLLSLPREMMKNGWSSGHGLNIDYYYHLPKVKGLSLGGHFGGGDYASKSQEEEYKFSDGTVTNTTVTLSSSIVSGSISARYAPIDGKKVSPFAEIQGGYMGMYSNLYIADPNDPMGCKALDNRSLVSDGSLFYALGGGFQVFLANGKKKPGHVHLLEISARALWGGEMEYANMNRAYITDDMTGNPMPNPEMGEKPLMVTFINASTSQLHEHTVAELYTHPLRMAQVQVQYVFRFN